MSDEIVLVVDGDELAFVHAIAAEQKLLMYKNTTNEFEHGFKNKTEFAKFTASLEVPDGFFTTEVRKVAEPKQNAFSTVKKKLLWLQNKFKTENIEIYISGDNNFRDTLPLPKNNDPTKSGQYKGQRDPDSRPILLDDVKEYLIKYWKADVVHGYEADDRLAMRVYDGYKSGQKIIGCTQDKDRLGNMGWWYDHINDEKGDGEPQFIDGLGEVFVNTSSKTDKPDGYGRKWLYYQWIAGDPVDNYDPRDTANQLGIKLKRFGSKTAVALLAPLQSDKECMQAVHDLYLSWYGKDKFDYVAYDDVVHTVDYIDVMQLYFNCARMLRFEGDKVCVRSMLTKMGITDDITIQS
ncbi:putative exodeoxyribonuclease [Rheinheimera phage Barba5S]|uniref:Putative exodeoxyribonuclease n=1 Tax=Rheinheimera phage Barba5S TaxID=2849599 RepID=A0A4P8MYF1_9CAUD|nr:putative exodeoxyribonuclease [Rheinheimera phage Barba5S]QCQ59093.1 putative exodeoxyribonuclease [Rheinheimera phage Barba5S]